MNPPKPNPSLRAQSSPKLAFSKHARHNSDLPRDQQLRSHTAIPHCNPGPSSSGYRHSIGAFSSVSWCLPWSPIVHAVLDFFSRSEAEKKRKQSKEPVNTQSKSLHRVTRLIQLQSCLRLKPQTRALNENTHPSDSPTAERKKA